MDIDWKRWGTNAAFSFVGVVLTLGVTTWNSSREIKTAQRPYDQALGWLERDVEYLRDEMEVEASQTVPSSEHGTSQSTQQKMGELKSRVDAIDKSLEQILDKGSAIHFNVQEVAEEIFRTQRQDILALIAVEVSKVSDDARKHKPLSTTDEDLTEIRTTIAKEVADAVGKQIFARDSRLSTKHLKKVPAYLCFDFSGDLTYKDVAFEMGSMLCDRTRPRFVFSKFNSENSVEYRVYDGKEELLKIGKSIPLNGRQDRFFKLTGVRKSDGLVYGTVYSQ